MARDRLAAARDALRARLSGARAAVADRGRRAWRAAPPWVRRAALEAAAVARRRPDAVLAACLLAGVAVMVAHWM